MGRRDDTTSELSERVLARLRREYTLVASEVWVDEDHRVDFVGFRPERLSTFPSSTNAANSFSSRSNRAWPISRADTA